MFGPPVGPMPSKPVLEPWKNLSLPGVVSYGWNNNDMDISDTLLIDYENTYESLSLP